MPHIPFATISHNLRRTSSQLRLLAKAKRLGIWHPGEMDLVVDFNAWAGLKRLLDWMRLKSAL